jgi:hypothetical protein
VAVRAIREESDTAIEAVNNWVAAEEVVQAIGAGEKPSVKEGAEQFENVFAERARLYEARADALEADDSPDADAEEIIRKAAFLRGRAREAMEFAQLVLQTVKH